MVVLSPPNELGGMCVPPLTHMNVHILYTYTKISFKNTDLINTANLPNTMAYPTDVIAYYIRILYRDRTNKMNIHNNKFHTCECVYDVGIYMAYHACGVQKQLRRVDSIFPPLCRFWGLNSCHQSYTAIPFTHCAILPA